MALSIDDLGDEVLAFVADRYLATLTIVRPDGTPHVTPVGFTWDDDAKIARIITWEGSQKARLLEGSGGRPAAVSQVDGGRWLTFEGIATVSSNTAVCADAVERYTARYRSPKDRGADRRTIEIVVTRVMGRA